MELWAEQQRQADALLSLARESFQRGHWKVALRRVYMLEARGYEVPEDLRSSVGTLAARCSRRELMKMRADAWAWGMMVRRRFSVVAAWPG